MYVKIDDDQFYDLLANDLKTSLIGILEDPYPLYHDVGQAYELVISMLDTLSYYMVETKYIELKNELYEDYSEFVDYLYGRVDGSFTVESIIENEDGSANMTFDIQGQGNIDYLISNGVKYNLILAALGCDDDTLVKWALRGKEEDKIDVRVRQELANRGL